VLNALSAKAMEEHDVPGRKLMPGMDALEAASVQSDDRVAMLGGFIPFIKALKGQVAELWVIDKHPEALKPDEMAFWRSPEDVIDVVSQASVVIMTGSSLVEGGIDDLLDAASNARRVVMAGPTASPWPPTFFERGVDVLGGVRVLDGPLLLQVVSEGGSGYFFDRGAEKVSVVRESNL
jgi:uncharacterized protein (DUF4213/DUF364 family)